MCVCFHRQLFFSRTVMAKVLQINQNPSSQESQGDNYRRRKCDSCNTFQCITLYSLIHKHNYTVVLKLVQVPRNPWWQRASSRPPSHGQGQHSPWFHPIRISVGFHYSYVLQNFSSHPESSSLSHCCKYTDLLKNVNEGSTNLTSINIIRA